MTALAIDPSEIKITNYRSVRERLMFGGSVPKAVQAALERRERAIARREMAVAQIEVSQAAMALKLAKREEELNARAYRLSGREKGFAQRERAADRRLRAQRGDQIKPEAQSIVEAEEVSRPRPQLREILACVSRRWSIEIDDLVSKRRTSAFVFPRRAYYAIARELTLRSLPEIARLCGRDHTTALHHVREAQSIIDRLRVELGRQADLSAWIDAIYREMNG
ncbi:helix-turn-helix domain-containing protein [Labrys sp. (in: a-proteobacteria)]|uniref:helix-turn-helix domain-containing protein n=1 Tax=Labrys sp. (in: a-proteobacteria) TaxID=1917972 RepID=UPI0039E6CC15